uniref:TLC domain-containing protein n=1 Tax=Haptolina ericina TaxID=156174 RepID=A0A7S3ADF6_9EUKA|mmetsp:Transcript_13040/g.29770  ORF Transcript_13040/g.29770 Transcript_13040/m.29770 type:complete len:234 (+) Transcript_13040:218-919(+)|eukprot:CAMPEP_0181235006 /NCGR_PEP_ID=MMETSP1096-20121128/37319_1 /TAXON_ID=156174 ORGANISM="Chrysochromulina ericina, Strain CCMP281" /NCGR_SAMPLE_ID=MMETSP1096 /ASSEMBLY_ACC=CAM_ASM_000453 /LENGTH=233 /DNA_ID=CAMNT_0023329905 /DNA_START=143 /DNA_END=847 /DNA_ORIENTATION=+
MAGLAPARRQCWTKLWTQLLVMPGIFLLSLAQHNFSMQQWSDEAATVLFSTDGTRWYDWAFGYVFGAYLLEDMLNDSLDVLMVWHHVGCCLGHFVAFVLLPAGFPFYFGGAVSLEFGSALYNLYCLYPEAKGMAWAFVLSMSLSNLAAAIFCSVWLWQDFPIAAKLFAGIVTSIFIVIRQKECMSEIKSINTPPPSPQAPRIRSTAPPRSPEAKSAVPPRARDAAVTRAAKVK